MTNELAKLDKATQMLAEAKSLDEVKHIMDIAEAARTYARAAKLGLDAYNHAAEVKARAERKAGEFLKQLERSPLSKGGNTRAAIQDEKPTSEYKDVLEESRINQSAAYRWQQVAEMPEEMFETHLEEMRGEKPITTSGILKKMGGSGHKASVTYKNQPAIDATHGNVPLAGNSHLYTVNKVLWSDSIQDFLPSLFSGRTLHVCCGKSLLGDVRLDLDPENNPDIICDAADMKQFVKNNSFDTVLCDPPYNGKFQWNHDLLEELARVSSKRIIFQHWFIPANPDGFYKKNNNFHLSNIYVWQGQAYFGRAQLISVFDWSL
jgi:hypothetical protein